MAKIKNLIIYCSLGLIIGGIISCENRKQNIPDVSSIPVAIEIERFDKELFAIDTTSWNAFVLGAEGLRKQYPAFYDVYFQNILRAPRMPRDTNYLNIIDLLMTNNDFALLRHDVDSVYPNLTLQNEQFTRAFQFYKYYFPQGYIPHIISYIADFQIGASTVDSILAVELDMFLGYNYRFYNSEAVDIPAYIQRKLTPEHLPATGMKAFAMQQFPMDESNKTLLHKMIYQGKLLYFLDKVLPETADSVKIGYTAEQMEWCRYYQGEIWADLLEKNILYSTDELKYAKYLNDAPFTSGLSNDSAPMLGVWTGWQIVREYMRLNPDVTLEQLMFNNDAQNILKQSKYKPK